MYWFARYPKESCTGASFVIGQVLCDRDLGDWTLTVHADTNSNYHAWLEMQLTDGRTVVVDSTVHQFPALSTTSYFGTEKSPALERFSEGEVYSFKMSRPDSHAAGKVPQFREMLEWVRSDIEPLTHPGEGAS